MVYIQNAVPTLEKRNTSDISYSAWEFKWCAAS